MQRATPLVKEPKRKLWFEIKPEHITKATRKCPQACTIALALIDAFAEKGDNLLEVIVYPTVVTLHLQGATCLRYKTPDKLKVALRNFDETGDWNLKPGHYYLEPISRNKSIYYRKEERKRRYEKDKAEGKPLKGSGKYTKRYTSGTKQNKTPTPPRFMNLKKIRDLCKI